MSSSKQVVSGVIWTTIQTVINRSSGFIVKMILARLLFPEDYGLVGMAVVFTSFFKTFTDLGFGSAIIQRKEEVLNDTYLSTAFWTNILWSGVTFAILCFVVGPFAAGFYNEPLLLYIVPASGIPIITAPLFLVQRSVMAKELQFKKIAVINNIASVSSGLMAVIMAFAGAGVWALVAQGVMQSVIEWPLYMRYAPWSPKRLWDRAAFKDMFGFGAFTTLSGLVYKFSSQGDYLLVGKLLGKIELGLYSFAFILTDSIRVQVRQIVDKVMYPIYSKTQDNPEKQIHFLHKSVLFNSLAITPLMGVLFVSTELITYIFGEKWVGSLIVIKIIAISVVIQIVTNSFSTIMRANDKSYLEFKLQALKVFVFYLPLIFIGTYYYGLVGCSIAVVLARLIINLINLWALHHYLSIKPSGIAISFFKGILPTFLAVILTLTVFYAVSTENVWISMSKTIILGGITALATWLINKKEINALLKLIKKRKQ
jgi:teichuronic acid exporter